MQSTTNKEQRILDNRLTEYPALAALRITVGDLDPLADQGFVCEERRGSRTYYKLRFRNDGKQIVRYIGSADRAAKVEMELSILQAETKIMRDLNVRTKIAKKLLRETKRAMEPLLRLNGFVFHGLAIRKPRQRRVEITNKFTS